MKNSHRGKRIKGRYKKHYLQEKKYKQKMKDKRDIDRQNANT